MTTEVTQRVQEMANTTTKAVEHLNEIFTKEIASDGFTIEKAFELIGALQAMLGCLDTSIKKLMDVGKVVEYKVVHNKIFERMQKTVLLVREHFFEKAKKEEESNGKGS